MTVLSHAFGNIRMTVPERTGRGRGRGREGVVPGVQDGRRGRHGRGAVWALGIRVNEC